MRNVPVDVNKLFRLWNTTMSSQEVADALGVGRSRLFFVARRYGLRTRPQENSTTRRPEDPTEEQIAERAAFVRSHWSPDELEKRAVGGRRASVEIRKFAIDPTTFSLAPVES